MNTATTTAPATIATAGFYWFDPAVAQLDPSRSDSLWTCSVRSPHGGVVCWAEGETPTETRDRCKTICAALNASRVAVVTPNPLASAAPDLLAIARMYAADLVEAGMTDGPVFRQVEAAIAKATGATA